MSDKKTPSWRAAELLEEIAKKAAPWDKLKKIIESGDLDKDDRFNFRINLTDRVVVATYAYPIHPTFDDVDGTPHEIVEWIKTGVTAGNEFHWTVTIEKDEHEQDAIIIKQTFRESWVVDEMLELFDKMAQH